MKAQLNLGLIDALNVWHYNDKKSNNNKELPHYQSYDKEKEYFTLDPSAIELFRQGKEGQGYVGIVDLEDRKIYLFPAWNRPGKIKRIDWNKKTSEEKNIRVKEE